jgi:hypothetical protein
VSVSVSVILLNTPFCLEQTNNRRMELKSGRL